MSKFYLRGIGAAATLVVWVLTAFLAPAAANARPTTSPYPPTTGCAVSSSRTAVVPGATLTITGSGFAANETVRLSIAGTTLGTVRTNAAGSFTAAVRIPSSVGPNEQIVASSASARCSFDATSAGSNSDQSHRETRSTASTGFPTAAVVVVAVILLSGGAALALLGRRRRLG